MLNIIAIIAIMVIIVLNYSEQFNKTKSEVNNPELARAMTYGEFSDSDENIEGTDSVKFGAFFLRDINNDGYSEKVKGTCKALGEQDSLYMSVKVSAEGSLTNGKIEIISDNIYFQTALIEDECIKNNYISNNLSEIELKDLSSGTQKLIFGNVRSGDYTSDSKKTAAINDNISKYTGINKVKLTGTYIAEDGTEIAIEKEINLTVDWYNKPVTEIPDKYNGEKKNKKQSYDVSKMLDQNNGNINLSFNITIQETEKIAKLSKSYIEGTIPELNGYEATAVEITGKNINYTYDSESKKFSAWREAEVSNTGKILVQCYSGEYEEKRFTEFALKVTYPIEAYQSLGINTVVLNIPVKGYYEGFNNANSEFENPVKSNIVEDIICATFEKGGGDVIGFDVKVGRYVGGDYDSWVISKNKATKYYNQNQDEEDTYEVLWAVARGDSGEITSIKMSEQAENYLDKFLMTDGTYIETKDIISNKGIYFIGASTMFDQEDGYIDVINDETNELLHRFNKEDWNKYNKNNPYIYQEAVNHIRIETSQAKNNSILYVYNVKQINHEKLRENYTQQEFDTFAYICTYLSGYVKYNETEIEYTPKKNDTDKANYDEEKSIATISNISSEYYSTQETKENVQLIISTKELSYNISKWQNGEFLLKFPKEILNIKINQLQSLNEKVEIVGYSIEEKEDGIYVKILTENDTPTIFDIYMEIDVSPDPRILNAQKNIELYYCNPICESYKNNAEDIYDIDMDGNIKEMIGKAEKSIQLIGPASMSTLEIASEYNENKDTLETAISPKVAIIDKNQKEKTAKITIQILNNYSGNIEEIKVVGKIPFEGNTYQLNKKDLGSMYTTTMISKIAIPENLRDVVKVYYSENETVTEDINDENNNWIEEDKITDLSKVKNYLIDFGNYSMEKGEKDLFTYGIQLPDNLNYNDISYATHAVYFALKTEEGKLKDKTEISKLGFMIAKKFNLKINKVKAETDIPLKNATYQIIDESNNESSIARTQANGTLQFDNLYIQRKYILKEIKAPAGYEKEITPIEFEATLSEEGRLELNILNGNVKKIIDMEGETLPTKEITLEDTPKYNLKLQKLEKDTDTPISDVEYEIKKEDEESTSKYKTKTDGSININNLELNTVYEIREITAKGYYLQEIPLRFVVNKEGNNYKLEVQKGTIKNSNIIYNNDNSEIPEVQINLENEKIPTWNLSIYKYSKDDESILLPGTSYKISGPGIEKEETYTTDENGKVNIKNLYLYVENKNIDGIYTIKESVPPAGYCLSGEEIKVKVTQLEDNTISFELLSGNLKQKTNEEGETTNDIQIDQESRTVSIGLEDEPLFKLTKIDGNTQEKLPNTKFAIWGINDQGEIIDALDSQGNLVGEEKTINGENYRIITTNENGEINIDLQPGIYKVIELEALEAYELSENIEDRTYYFGIGKSQDEIKKWVNDYLSQINFSSSIKDFVKVDTGYIVVSNIIGRKTFSSEETSNGEEITIQNEYTTAYLMKYDEENKLEWFRSIEGEDVTVYTHIKKAPDGGFFTIGAIKQNGKIKDEDTLDGKEIILKNTAMFINKINQEGLVEYSRTIECANLNNKYIYDMAILNDGSFIICGYSYGNLRISPENTSTGTELQLVTNDIQKSTGYIISFNKDGKAEFVKSIEGEGNIVAEYLTVDENNTIVIAGSNYGNMTIPAEDTEYGNEINLINQGYRDIITVRINKENQKIISAQNLGSTSYDYVYGAIILDNNIICIGHTNNPINMPADYMSDGKERIIGKEGEYTSFNIIYDENGKIDTIQTITSQSYLYTSAIKETNDGGYIVNVIGTGDITIPSELTKDGNEMIIASNDDRRELIIKFNNEKKIEWLKEIKETSYYNIKESNKDDEMILVNGGNTITINNDGEIVSEENLSMWNTASVRYIRSKYTNDGGKIIIGGIQGHTKIYAEQTANNEDIMLDSEANNMLLLKYNKEDRIEWATVVKGFRFFDCSNIVEVEDGYFISQYTSYEQTIAGESCEDGNEITIPASTLVLIKINNNGLIQKVTPLNIIDGQGEIINLTRGKQGIGMELQITKGEISIEPEYVESKEKISLKTNGSREEVIIAFDNNGNAKWGYVVSAPANNFVGNITGTEDGGYISAGTFWNTYNIASENTVSGNVIQVKSNGAYDYVITKFTKDGLIEWAISEGGTGREYSYDITSTSDNGFILKGDTISSSYTIPAEKTEKNEEISLQDGESYNDVIIKYNENHLIEWATKLNGINMGVNSKIIESKDGGYYVGSYARANTSIPAELTVDKQEIKITEEGSSYVIIKLNNEGLIEWVRNENSYFQDYTEGKFIFEDYESYEKTITPDIAEKQEITIENYKKTYAITTKVIEGKDGNKGGTITGENEIPYETVKHGENSLKQIKITPDADYKVLKITVNDKEIPFETEDDGSVILEQFEKVTTNKNVTVQFSKTISNIVIHHYKDGTKEELVSDETLRGEVGENYTTAPKEIEGYELVTEKMPYNASGKYPEYDDEVYYYYKERPVKLVVKYYEEGTEQEVSPTIEEEHVKGDSYITEQATEIDPKYELIEIPANAEGILEGEETTVIYYYRIKDVRVITKVEKHKEINEFGEIIEVAGGTISGDETIKYNENTTKDIIIKPDEGYYIEKITINGEEIEFIVEEDGSTQIDKFINLTEDKNISVEFTKSESKVIIHHYEEGTTNKVSENVIIIGEEGENYKTEPATDIPIKYELSIVPENAEGTMTNSTIDVIYYYRIKDAELIIKYLEKGTEQEIAKTEYQHGKVDEDYITAEKTIENYVLVEHIGNEKGKLEVNPITIIYYYAKISNVRVRYIDITSNEEIADQEVIEGYEGKEYTTEEKEIEGYKLVKAEESYPSNSSGIMSEEETVVTYYYIKESTVTAKYIDQISNQEISEEIVLEGLEGEEYKTEEKDIEGYELIQIPENAEGKFPKAPIEVIYYYKRPAKVIVNYLDEETDEKLLEEKIIEGYEGDEYQTEAEEISYYKLRKEPDNKKGKMTVIVNKTEENNEEVTEIEDTIYVDYYYKKLEFNMQIEKTISTILVNGQTTPVNSQIGKIEINKGLLSTTNLKVQYAIKITNTGELAGSAEVTEKIPEGMTMKKEDNTNWTINNTVATIQTEEINPGESTIIDVVMTWQNTETNTGNKQNMVEITRTKNIAGFEEKDDKDNVDAADMVISIGTGTEEKNNYTILNILFALGLMIIAIEIAVILKKKNNYE